MTIYYNRPTEQDGLIQALEDRLKLDDAYISGDSVLLKKITREVNTAVDEIDAIIQSVGGTHGYDDINHTKYPELTLDLVANQRDYFITKDEQGNRITDIFKVFVKGEEADSIYQEVYPVDSERDENVDDFYDGQDSNGVPYRYNKHGGGFFFDPIPDYDQTDGIKILFERTGSYFQSTDTTKEVGFNPQFIEYIIDKVCYVYARDNDYTNVERYKRDLREKKEELIEYYGNRDTRDRVVMNPFTQPFM